MEHLIFLAFLPSKYESSVPSFAVNSEDVQLVAVQGSVLLGVHLGNLVKTKTFCSTNSPRKVQGAVFKAFREIFGLMLLRMNHSYTTTTAVLTQGVSLLFLVMLMEFSTVELKKNHVLLACLSFNYRDFHIL